MNFRFLLGAPQSAHVLFWDFFISSNIATRFFSDILIAKTALHTKRGRGESTERRFSSSQGYGAQSPRNVIQKHVWDSENSIKVYFMRGLKNLVSFVADVGALLVRMMLF